MQILFYANTVTDICW